MTALVAAVLVACGGSSPTGPGSGSSDPGSTVASVQVQPSSSTLSISDTARVSAKVTGEDGTDLNRSVSWRVTDPGAARVNTNGVVLARSGGESFVVADVDGVRDSARITVQPSSGSQTPEIPDGVTVTEVSRTGSTVTYRAEWGPSTRAEEYPWDAGANDGEWIKRLFTLSSRSTQFEVERLSVDVQAFFCVEGLNPDGTSAEGSCTGYTVPAGSVTSGDPGGSVASVEVSPSSTRVDVGASVDLDATARDGSGDPVSASFSWSSSNTSVATVDGSGRVTGQAEGAAEVTATADGVSDAATVDVVTATSPPSGDIPTPDSNDRVVFDTRAGGSHDLQAMTTEAEVEAIFQNPTPHPDGGWGLTTDFDGNGTHAIRLEWPRASNSDVGRLLIVDDLGSSDPSELYMQYKVWMGRTETGGGIGDIGAFDFTNDNEAGAARKILRAFTNPWSGSDQPFQSFNFHGSDPYTTTLSVCAGGASECGGNPSWHVGSWRSPGDLENRATTFTMYVKHESSQGAGDGEFGIWIDGDRILYETGLTLGGHSINRWQFPMIIRSPVQDQTEYIWDVVAWDPQ